MNERKDRKSFNCNYGEWMELIQNGTLQTSEWKRTVRFHNIGVSIEVNQVNVFAKECSGIQLGNANKNIPSAFLLIIT